jgi:hypothetical protein
MRRGGDIPSYSAQRHSFVITIRIFRGFLLSWEGYIRLAFLDQELRVYSNS